MFNSIKKFFSLVLCLSFLVSQTGCSFLAGSHQPFSATASEPDAKIFINGQFVGVGSVQTNVKRDQSVSVMATKDGYYPSSREIGTKLSSYGILDLIGGCIFLLPFIGLAAAGSHEVEQTSVSIILQKAK